MSRNLDYKHATLYGVDSVEISKHSGSVFSFPLFVDIVNPEIRALVARGFIEALKEFVDWLDEPPIDWARIYAHIPPLDSTHAETLKEKGVTYTDNTHWPQVAELSLSGASA